MAYELIISEKPNAAKKIAEALADGKPKKESDNKIPFYTLTHKGKDIIVGCTVGHIFGLREVSKDKRVPVFDIEWAPKSEIDKSSSYTKKYFNTLKKLVKRCDSFTVATDFDIEGEVIGLNIIKYLAKQEDANRMKFSTLTKDELVSSYEEKNNNLEWGQAKAGDTRHKLDWYYGINFSRVLTYAIKKSGMFKLLSTGRVQGPALKILSDREQEIKNFKPTPYWELELSGKLNSEKVTAYHKKGKFDKEKDVLDIVEKTKNQPASVKEISRKEFKQQPPFPFDLTSLQVEAYGKLGIPPKQTLNIAQELYTSGFTSYPRTSSQKLPSSLNFKKILNSLKKQEKFKDICDELLGKGSLKPNNGKKEDPAHPAIHPTGNPPSGLEGRSRKIYDLIVRRFLSTFGEAATRETVGYNIDCASEIFVAKGTITKDKGWLEYYAEFVKQKEEELPKAKEGDQIENKKIKKLDKETEPPKRYTESSIIKELEKRNLGTKATRASIIDTLFQRNYVQGKKLEVTDLGMHISQILQKYFPQMNDEEMTRHFEEEMEKIREQKKDPNEVLEEAKKVITDLVTNLKNSQELGEELKKTFSETKDKTENMGECPNCESGNLKLRKGKFGRFIACDQYPECKTTYSLPAKGTVKKCDKKCETCGGLMVSILSKGKKQDVCLNPDCPSKQTQEKVENEGKTCPKCGKGKLALKNSVYGKFLACDKFPKCKYIEQINNNKSDDEKESKKQSE